jgi:hypothetical protein
MTARTFPQKTRPDVTRPAPDDADPRLRLLRGSAAPKRHNARTIAALTSNPGCARRAVIDAAGIDKVALARGVGFPAQVGQSQFAIIRGNAFEAQVKANGCAELLRLLRELLGLDLSDVGYTDLDSVGGNDSQQLRHIHARNQLLGADSGESTFFDHPLLRLPLAGQDVYLEPDLVAFQHNGQFHVVEIKSFAVIDGQADAAKVAAAAIQAAVYVLALREVLGDPDAVSHDIVLVCPENFANRPVAVKVDVRRQLSVLEHQIARLVRVDRILDDLPPGLTFDLAPNDKGEPTRTAAELADALRTVDARYSPDCISSCEMAFFCRDEATHCTSALGRSVREDLGGVETVAEALGLADGSLLPGVDQEEIATQLRMTARVYQESLTRGAA